MTEHPHITPRHLRILRAIAAGKVLVHHRKGWVLSDGSISCEDATKVVLAARGLIAPIALTRAWQITDAGRKAATEGLS